LGILLVLASTLTGADEVREPDGTTALHRAVDQDDLEKAKALLKAGGDVKAANRYGVTPLSLACTNGSGAMVSLLLDIGCRSEHALPGGETALMTAARTGRLDAVRALLARGADVHAKDPRRGQTALMWAAAEGNVDVVDALLAAGADWKARLDSGYTAFLFAVREGRAGVVRTLLKAGADVNDSIPLTRKVSQPHGAPRAGTSALHLAVGNAHFELAAALLDAGADPNAIGPGYTPLHMVTWVRKAGGGDNDPAPDGSGTMTSLQMVKKLADKGANLNARMTKKVSVGLTSFKHGGRDAVRAGGAFGGCGADALSGETGRRPSAAYRGRRDPVDRRRGTRHTVAGRGRRDGERSGGSARSRHRTGQRSECRGQERRDRHARGGVQESARRG
jgi:hypothetical protein